MKNSLKNILNLSLIVSMFFLFSCASTMNSQDDIAGVTATSQQNKNGNLSIEDEILGNVSQLKNSDAYLLQPGDLLEISVFREPEMDRTLRINTTGTITFPLVGTIKVSNCSIAQAEETLVNSLTKYLKNPQVSILIKEYANNTVYVLGQVKRPSSLQIPPEKNLTVLEAITSAGGFTELANTSKVKVLRMENGKQKSIEVDISQITKQGKKSLDINLMSGDVIFVPQSIF
jgi:polysaccharide export outer membrane protein